jgi:hypothetical protein
VAEDDVTNERESKPRLIGSLGRAAVLTASLLNFSSVTLAHATDPDVILTIWVANYARVPRHELFRAERVTGGIFHDAGIETIWIDVPLDERHLEPKYDGRPGDMHLTILRHAAPGAFSPHELGFTMPCPEPKTGCLAYIFYALVLEFARDGEVSKSEMLGAAMAHEIGHMLLGQGHSWMGVMKPHWTERDLHAVASHQLTFMPHETKQLYAAAHRLRRGATRTD